MTATDARFDIPGVGIVGIGSAYFVWHLERLHGVEGWTVEKGQELINLHCDPLKLRVGQKGIAVFRGAGKDTVEITRVA